MHRGSGTGTSISQRDVDPEAFEEPPEAVARLVVLEVGPRGGRLDTPTADVGGTWHGGGLTYRLDAIYSRGVTPGAASVDREVDGSDHWPVILDVTL